MLQHAEATHVLEREGAFCDAKTVNFYSLLWQVVRCAVICVGVCSEFCACYGFFCVFFPGSFVSIV